MGYLNIFPLDLTKVPCVSLLLVAKDVLSTPRDLSTSHMDPIDRNFGSIASFTSVSQCYEVHAPHYPAGTQKQYPKVLLWSLRGKSQKVKSSQAWWHTQLWRLKQEEPSSRAV